ncbi:MAG: type II toxin-antitoxin system VapC family toxin [Pyrinomonadaceae bacterium]|nr:type II toxin-antitoxin system VapC family toxin [Pyrinomonadaceae bacterium]
MKLIFADSSGWLGLVNTTDSVHQKATQIYDSKYAEGYNFITHQGILLEVGNSLSGLRLRQSAVGLKNKLEKSQRVEIRQLDNELYKAGWKLYAERTDKNWGIVDCISFVLMERLNIREAFTADRHFEQAGYIKLL